MEKLNLPEYKFKIIRDNDKLKIFDETRKKYVALTPEEWVRQNIIKWLIIEKSFPSALISIESGLKYNRLKKRSDAVVYNRDGEPAMLIEFKAPDVEIDDNTIKQILSYNYSINAPYLLISNGKKHYCLKRDLKEKKFVFLEDVPLYSDLIKKTEN